MPRICVHRERGMSRCEKRRPGGTMPLEFMRRKKEKLSAYEEIGSNPGHFLRLTCDEIVSRTPHVIANDLFEHYLKHRAS